MYSFEKFKESFARYRPSAWALVLANAAPLLGVIFLGWEAFDIVALYWAENVVIGLVNVLKILTCRPDPAQLDFNELEPADKRDELKEQLQTFGDDGTGGMSNRLKLRMGLAAFFAVHYGFFCFVHGLFIVVLLGPRGMFGDPFDTLGDIVTSAGSIYLLLAILCLAASHLYSYACNYIGRGEYRGTHPVLLMFKPYARIVVLHLAILFGGFVAVALGSGMGLLVLLIVGKTLLDLSLHFRERRRSESPKQQSLDDLLSVF